jgi:type IV secretion system protein TrbI
MALVEESVATPDKSSFAKLVAARPMRSVMVMFVGLSGTALVLSRHKPPVEGADQAVMLTPDTAAADEVQAAAASLAISAPSEPPLVVPMEANALATAQAGAATPDGAGPAAFLGEREKAYEKFLLDVQQLMLQSRLRGRVAPLRAEGFMARAREDDERMARNAELLRQSGITAGADEGMGGGLGGLAVAGMSPALAALASGGNVLGGGAGGLGSMAAMGGAGGQQDPNFNAAKLDFFQNGGRQLEPGRLQTTVRPAASPYELLMGSVIPGVLLSGINTEGPGQITGQVSENVFDSATGQHLLIPQGSRLVGTYSALVAQGQARVQVAWVRLNYPNGDKLDLGGMSGTDQAGTAGFRDKVNRHFMEKFAAALMTSAITVAYELSAPRNGSFYEGAVHRGVGESIVRVGIDAANRNAQIPPTIEIRPGYRFSIAVSKDIVFPGAYDDGIQRRRAR